MKLADANRNGELSFTELTSFLEGTPQQAFGRWVKARGQKGFRMLDFDRGGSIDEGELAFAAMMYLQATPGG
jgi:hypothetical protein